MVIDFHLSCQILSVIKCASSGREASTRTCAIRSVYIAASDQPFLVASHSRRRSRQLSLSPSYINSVSRDCVLGTIPVRLGFPGHFRRDALVREIIAERVVHNYSWVERHESQVNDCDVQFFDYGSSASKDADG